MCHNIFVDRNYLFYNASAAREFIAVDLAKETVVKKLPFPGFHTKGMSVTQDYIVIGLSAHAAHYMDRIHSVGRLAVIDRHTLSVIKVIEVELPTLAAPIGNINEIRCLSEPELGHSATTTIDLAWNSLRLAKSSTLRYRLQQLKMKSLKPLRNVKRQWEKQHAAKTNAAKVLKQQEHSGGSQVALGPKMEQG
jgi:hypothetical protein